MSIRWLAHAERSNAFFLTIIGSIALRLGRRSARCLLYPITLYYLLTAHAERKASLVYMTRVHGRRATWWDVARHIHTFAATLVDRCFFFTGQFDQMDVQIHNAELPLKHLKEGRPGILLGSHLGSFEALRAMGLLHQKLPLKILMHREHNRVITTMLNALNPLFAESVIEIDSPTATLEIHKQLSKGYFIGMLGDRPQKNSKVVKCNFLGKEAEFPTGSLYLAHVCKVPIIMFFGLYRGGKKYDIYFELLADKVVLKRGERDREIKKYVSKYAETLENFVRQEPYNWFNFYDYWDEYSSDKLRPE